jgi:tetratricopeptide (TPR) repeat protein
MPREGKVQLPFIEDDYPRALSEARSRGVPLFVDAGAPWCHTCRSMQAFVFTDPAIAGEAARFVWLEINTERANNVTFVKKYPVPALPTYFVIDPVTERAALRWVGGTSVEKMIAVLKDGREMVRAARDSRSGTAAAGGASSAFQAADRTFARAESLYAVPQDSLAAEAYLEALALAAPGWKHDSRAVESGLFALTQSGLNARAARLAIESLPRLGRSTSSGNIVGTGLEAALEVPASDPARAGMIQTLEQAAKSIAADRTIDMAADDRSGVYIALLDARHDANDDAGAHQVASDWATFLEGEAARATTADARAVFDPHRLSAYIELGQPERAIPMLEASERALPDDYDPPARLAIAYREMKRWQDALAASDRALEKAYGPRTLGMYQVRTDIYLGMGDTLQARSTLQHAIEVANGFPPGQRPQRTIATLEQRLTALR